MFRGINFSASLYIDRNAVGHYRQLFVNQALLFADRNRRILESPSPIRDREFLSVCDSVRVQRLSTQLTKPWYDELVSNSKENGTAVIYDVDDLLIHEDIPEFNLCKQFFHGCEGLINHYMSTATLITVSTVALKNYYSDRFGIDKSKFVVIPNYIPKWWCRYQEGRSLASYRAHKTRPRILISCSTSHFGLDKDIKDDFSGINKWIIDNRKKYLFVFQGGINKELSRYKSDFAAIPSTNIMEYQESRMSVEPSLCIQPLEDCVFNRCKSEIKIHESALLGIPVLVQDLPMYRDLNSSAVFSDSSSLEEKVNNILSSEESYLSTIRHNYGISKDYYLEDHLDEWRRVIDKEF